jgi:hypothetical protein
MRLKADFEADWVGHLRSELVLAQGWSASEVAALDDRDIRYRYLDGQRRRIAIRPRAIQIAHEFLCPPQHEPGWKTLQAKALKGEDLNPHLSKRHASLFNSDGLLAEWGVHHFHLGRLVDASNPAYVERTGPLLYALVNDQTFCAINLYSHQDFENTSVLEIIHNNWPDLISRYRVRGVTAGSWSAAEKRAFRLKNGNVLTAVADGAVYMPISGGVMASGVSAEAVRLADFGHDRIRALQTSFELKLPELLPTLTKHGYAGEDEVEAQLKIAVSGPQVYFPKFGVLVNLAVA